MWRAATLFAAFVVAFPLSAALSQTASPDKATLARSSLNVGEQVALRLEVHTAAGQTVEINPGGSSWNGVELVRISSVRSRPDGADTVHTIDAVVASFQPGEANFRPAVTIVSGADAESRLLPALSLKVSPILGPNDPLELSPLAATTEIEGAESPLLKPAIAAGALAGIALIAGLGFLFERWLTSRPSPSMPEPGAIALPPTLEGAEQAIASDPVAAYRALASIVRGALGSRYGFPAPSLTTQELKRRMEREGVDRWQARLVGGLLDECDAVIYAGYRPAGERRQADLTMAREIVEAVA